MVPERVRRPTDVVRFAWAGGGTGTMTVRWAGGLVADLTVEFDG